MLKSRETKQTEKKKKRLRGCWCKKTELPNKTCLTHHSSCPTSSKCQPRTAILKTGGLTGRLITTHTANETGGTTATAGHVPEKIGLESLQVFSGHRVANVLKYLVFFLQKKTIERTYIHVEVFLWMIESIARVEVQQSGRF